MVSKKSSHYLCEDGIENPSLVITVCHHSASLVMPVNDPQDGFFYPSLTLMIDSYKDRRVARSRLTTSEVTVLCP